MSEELLTTLRPPRGILLVVSGAAGTGKSTVDKLLIERHPGYSYSVSATTRERRPGETEGTDYHFLTVPVFEQYIRDGAVIEYTKYCGNYYGTLKEELKKLDLGIDLILEIETEGAMNIKRMYPDSVTVFILPPDYDTLVERIVSRGTNTPEDIADRMEKAKQEFAVAERYDYVVVNRTGRLEETADAIHAVVTAEKHRLFRNADALKNDFISPFENNNR